MPIPERRQLRPVSTILFDEMSALCDAIERDLEAGATADALLQRWHVHALRDCDAHEFRTYWKSVSKEDFVRDALRGCETIEFKGRITEDEWEQTPANPGFAPLLFALCCPSFGFFHKL